MPGSNGATDTDFYGRRFAKLVSTGWSNAGDDDIRSEILTLSRMVSLGTNQTDVLVLEENATLAVHCSVEVGAGSLLLV